MWGSEYKIEIFETERDNNERSKLILYSQTGTFAKAPKLLLESIVFPSTGGKRLTYIWDELRKQRMLYTDLSIFESVTRDTSALFKRS